MSIPPGTRLGAYEVVALIGVGAMGEVYRATDTKLHRAVAIKVLPDLFANDSERLARFQREAQVLASLNHPNIGAIYGLEETGGVHALVLELVEGPTLADVLRQGPPEHLRPLQPASLPDEEAATDGSGVPRPLTVDEVLPIARQIAQALEAAHEHAIIHRDLKPANIKLRSDGTVKLLDFGLAKLMDGEDVTRTREGTVLGTVAYMSPEQAEGKPLDERSDVFAFGAVLYEMLSGRRAFGGDTAARVMSAVLRDDPPVFQTPPALERIMRRCLAKQPADRFRAMRDVKAALAHVSLTPVKDPPSIAVLPFASMSPDPENEYFSDGISEEIINALAQIEGLHVAARTSSFSFKGKSVEIGDIAKRLNVRHVLEGSVRKAGDRVRVTAQLVDASNGYQLWSERYDRQLADIFDVQDEIARTIVGRLRVALAGGAASRLVKATTSNMEAYQEYLKGRAMLYRRGPWVPRALASLQKAVALDPEYSQALAGVAEAYTTACYSGYGRPSETMPAALDAATRATVADPGSAEAHNALAVAALLWERDFAKAEHEFLEALALNPRFMQARCWYGLFFLLWGVGRHDDGLSEIWRAFEADPLSSYATTVLSFALATVHRFDEAVLQARVAVQQDPESFLGRWELGLAYHWNGQPAEAIAVLEPLWAESGHNWAVMGLVPAYKQAGREDQARDLYQSLVARGAREYVQPFLLAVCATALDDVDAAIASCETAVQGRDMLFSLLHRWWPDFERVRIDPRFPDILARFNSRGGTRA